MTPTIAQIIETINYLAEHSDATSRFNPRIIDIANSLNMNVDQLIKAVKDGK